MYEPRLFTPGPTHVPVGVRVASLVGTAHHRAPGYASLHSRVVGGLLPLFGTSGDVLPLSGSGSTAMEAVVRGIVEPGDPVLVLDGGKYGRRWAQLAEECSAAVETYAVPSGETFDPGVLGQHLERRRPRHVLLTHCETSTGVTHDVAALAAVARRYDVTVVLDAMATVGVEPVAMDDWGVDIAVAASHKGLMSPPGAAFVAVAERGWSVVRPARSYSCLDLVAVRDSGRELTTPNTPPISVLFAVAEALDLIAQETAAAVFERHERTASACRAGARALGLGLFARGRPSAAVTAVTLPGTVDLSGIVAEVETRFGMRIAGGQGELAGRILRIGHVGAVSALDLLPLFAALEIVAVERGLLDAHGPAVTAVTAAVPRGVPASPLSYAG